MLTRKLGVLFLACLCLCGCATTDVKKILCASRFYVENEDCGGAVAKLPMSGVTVHVFSQPILTEFDIDSAELRDGLGGKILVFRMDERAAYALFSMSVMHASKRVVLECNGEIVGITTFSSSLTDGVIIIYPERTDAELADLMIKINDTAVSVNKIKKS